MSFIDELTKYMNEGVDDIYEKDIVYYVGDDDSFGISADDELRVVEILDGAFKVRALHKPEIKDYITIPKNDIVLAK